MATTPRSLMDQWIATTTTWADPVAALGAGTVTALMPDVLPTVLTEGVLRRFGGRRIDVSLRARHLRAELAGMQLRRHGAAFDASIDMRDVDFDGRHFDRLTVTADGVKLIPNLATRVTVDHITLTGSMPIADLVEWLHAGEFLDWDLTTEADGLVHAHHRRTRLQAVVDPVIRRHRLRIHVHRARWLGVNIPVGMMPVLSFILPDLPDGSRIVRAVRRDQHVHFEIDCGSRTGTIDLAQIRSAVAAGTRLIVW
ncbi:MAG TPA: hypothetical protein VIW24_14585 [Aldersonia sp.]